MRNIQEKSVYMCVFWIGTNRHLFCTHVQKPPGNIQYYAPNLVPNPTIRPISWQILPSKKMATLFFIVLHESPLLNTIFDPLAKSVGFFFKIYPVYDYFSSSSWLSLSSSHHFLGAYRHTLDILWVWFQIFLIEYQNKMSRNLFAGGGSCLQFVKNATPVKHSKAKHNEMRYACVKIVS